MPEGKGRRQLAIGPRTPILGGEDIVFAGKKLWIKIILTCICHVQPILGHERNPGYETIENVISIIHNTFNIPESSSSTKTRLTYVAFCYDYAI